MFVLKDDSLVQGTIYFEQKGNGEPVMVLGTITGLTEDKYEFHVYLLGDIYKAVPVQVLTLILYSKYIMGQRIKRGMLETYMWLLAKMVWLMYLLKRL